MNLHKQENRDPQETEKQRLAKVSFDLKKGGRWARPDSTFTVSFLSLQGRLGVPE